MATATEKLIDLPEPETEFIRLPKRVPRAVSWGGWLLVIVVGVLVGVQLVYAGKALPGVSANGASISGLGQAAGETTVGQHLSEFNNQLISLTFDDQTISINADKLGVSYDNAAAVRQALAYGHHGSLLTRLAEEMRALLGRPSDFSAISLDGAKLNPYLDQMSDVVQAPASSASFNFSDTSATVTPSMAGRRLNRGYLVMQLEHAFAYASSDTIAVPVVIVQPMVETAELTATRDQAATYVSAPITLHNGTATTTITPQDIISWIKITSSTPKLFADTGNIQNFYSIPAGVTLSINHDTVAAYVANLAKGIDTTAQNAALTISGGVASVFQPSRTGLQLDQAATVTALEAAVAKPSADRAVTLAIKTVQPDVREDNLNNLGIKELISEGITYFPGSNAARLNNIRLGAALYNGLLVKPGDVFSFNKYFINVDAAHGWSEGLSIIGDKIEPLFGGGICQVSSTAYRAALLAGLPINERTNHAYAVSFYTAPFGVPGIDATVYNPGVDFKFTNDTGAYILIQTIMDTRTNSLKFDFYGTKTKIGQLRGPTFIDGSLDDTKPSTTIFYRDILDLSGKVIETDPVTTHYKSSLDFTHVTTP